jgi:hypothetical protein
MADINTGGWLSGKKTYIVAITTILSAIGSYLVGDASLATTIQFVVTAVLGMTIRSGITTEVKK